MTVTCARAHTQGIVTSVAWVSTAVGSLGHGVCACT